ncbi:MAG: hypothetical protein HYV04_14380 [Deltaproteobacteria bacterium]|nr:hypothetical protein [Deltaproteobacteria bacterium]
MPIESGGWKENIRCAFRRWLCDGQAVARVEVGLSWIPEYEETLLWRYWAKTIKDESDPAERVGDAETDINPLDIVRYIASIPTTVHPMASAEARYSVPRPLILQGRALSHLYWRATTKSNTATPDGAVVQGVPVVLIECRSHWISRLPKNFVRVGSESAAYVNLAFGRMQTPWGPLGVWLLGHQQAYTTESRSLRLCLLRLHAEQEVLDIVLGHLADGTLEYSAAETTGDCIEAYLNKATRLIYRQRWGGVEQSAVLAAFDAADATDYRAVRVQLAEQLKGARKQVLRKIEMFERRAYVRADRFIHVESGSTYVEKVEHMTSNKTINIGHGNTLIGPIVIADHIENSFNTLEKSGVNPELKVLIGDLLKQVTEASKAMPQETAKQAGSDAETLVKEVTAGAPRKKWYELSIEGLRDAAKAVGDIGKPILETTGKLLPLLNSLFP